MTPHQLATRLSALDWSSTSLQHQLAISAAITTLEGRPAVTMPDLSNVIAHPALKRTHRTVTLNHLDGRPFASAGFSGGCAGDSWAWIVETVSHEWGVSEEAVGCMEAGEEGGGDFVTVDGLPLYRISL